MKNFKSQDMRIAAKLHHAVFMMEKFADKVMLEKLGMSFVQVMILMRIKHCGHSSQKDLAHQLGVTPGAMSRQIDILREKELIVRTIREDNRREHDISLSQGGERLIDDAMEAIEHELHDLFDLVTKAEKDVFEEIISKFIIKLDPECNL